MSSSSNVPEKATWDREINDSGEFVRRPTTFHDFVRADGSTPYLPESGRYHLYVSYACPWAHRVLIGLAWKGLEDHISYDVVDTHLDAEGWKLTGKEPGATGDRVNGFRTLRQAFLATDASFSGTVTVPTLWDKKRRRVVNNESAEILRMLNAEFQKVAERPDADLYPTALRVEIDQLNDWIYSDLNDGVYQAGFARSQQAYEKACFHVFQALDRLEGILSQRRYLVGSRVTEADVRLYPTLVRFDSVYFSHFKCNVRRVVDYPNLWGYVRDLYTLPEFQKTLYLDHIKKHYFGSHDTLNPSGIIPVGPAIDWDAPHERMRLG